MRLFASRFLTLGSLAFAVGLLPSASGCGSSEGNGANPPTGPNEQRNPDQTEFVSAPPAGQSGQGRGTGDGSEAAPSAGADDSAGSKSGASERKVEETDLYRLDGNTLYYLNGYRGLMVFDVTNVDQPKLVGRSPIYGYPSEMIVRNGIATVVVGDWYGTDDAGDPFYGSIVRTFDARDPSNIKVLGDARVRGWVSDTRVVGDVMYTVSQDYGYVYGYYDGTEDGDGTSVTSNPRSKVIVTSVRFGSGKPSTIGTQEYDGYSAAFNVTAKSILFAHDIPKDPKQPWGQSSGKTRVDLIDIQDPNGAISVRGGFDVDGTFQGWGTDNGRWNVDFAGERYARVLTCAAGQYGYCDSNSSYLLSAVDFQNPKIPLLASSLSIANPGWSIAARFSGDRLYLSPSNGYWNGSNTDTPVQIYDLTNAASPSLAGSVQIPGMVWNFTPMGDKIFALGSTYQNGGYGSSQVSVSYIDAANPAAPQLLGTSSFGEGWAWTPAAGTFKAFTLDTEKNLVVLPFSGWSNQSYEYNNGLQLIQFTDTSIATAGAAKTKGWVERGIFVKNRLVSLSDLALSVVDYANPASPKTVAELTLARNVVAAEPLGDRAAQLSTDWWGYDASKSELRVTSLANIDETKGDATLSTLDIEGTNAQMFKNGNFGYVVTTLVDKSNSGKATTQVQVVDFSNGNVVLRGKIALPDDANYYGYYYGWGGCGWSDWWYGSEIVQVEGSALAFRRTRWEYDPVTQKSTAEQKLYVVDLANPEAPAVASTSILPQTDGWWGNMRAVGDTLYTTHYEWVEQPVWDPNTGTQLKDGKVKYFLDRVDIGDRTAPHVQSSVNVPGILVGGSETDASLLYFIDYRWMDNQTKDELSVARLVGDKAHLLGTTTLDGYTGSVFVRGNKAYLSAQEYTKNYQGKVRLHEIDLTDPAHPVDRASESKKGWGWLLGVEGDRAIVMSGWASQGIDVYRLNANAAPTFDKFVRTRGWWANSLARQGNTLLLSSGYWGVQAVDLQ